MLLTVTLLSFRNILIVAGPANLAGQLPNREAATNENQLNDLLQERLLSYYLT